MRECARQNNAADAAGRGAGYAVDDDPKSKGSPYRLQECKIDILGIMRSPVIAICGFITLVYSLLRLWDRMICLGRSRKLQDFFDLRHAYRARATRRHSRPKRASVPFPSCGDSME